MRQAQTGEILWFEGIPPVSYNLYVSGKRISTIGVLSSRGMEDTCIKGGSVEKLFTVCS